MESATQPYLSVVIPMYREGNRIAETIYAIRRFLDARAITHELILVDDGSDAPTRHAAEQFSPFIHLTERRPNRGKGYAVRQGMLIARGQYLLFSDADLAVPIETISDFLKRIADRDIIIASRFLPNARVQGLTVNRRFLGRAFNAAAAVLVGMNGIKDTQCGFKLFHRAAANIVFSRQTVSGFGFDVELLVIARKHGLRVQEIPVVWTAGPQSSLRIFRDSTAMCRELLSVRRNLNRGQYT
ncbi:MAG: dolichyl-phosphate beta-glucosyltransferase [Patescibacteria group bacterium]